MPTTPDPALLEQLRASLASSYEIESEMAGGMSRVFVAMERALGRRVVIKVLPPELTAGVNRERFRREIQFAARLQHPHIVPLLTAGQLGDILYYTMPLVEGETLRSRLEREGSIPAATVVSILQDVVDALAYAHGQGLVHRDIKPENILLQRHHALITDFGVAKAINDSLPGSAATTVGVAVGTPAYMAPEQLAADPAGDHRIDLYAVGLLAYELLSGSSPFAGSSPQQTLARQMTERPTPPHIQRADVPPALSALIMRCLEKEPAARWASADALLQALSAVRITASAWRAVPRETARPKRRNRVLGGALLALLTVAGVGYALLRGPGPGSPNPPKAAPGPPDTVKAAAPKTDTVRTPSLLTRADSEAIAASVARQMNRKRAAPAAGLSQQNLDSIRNEVQRSVTDSVMRMLAAAPPRGQPGRIPQVRVISGTGFGGPARVLLADVADRSADKSLGSLAGALTDSLRRLLAGRQHTALLPRREVGTALQRTGDLRTAGLELGADYVVRGYVEGVRSDSVQVVFDLLDTRDPRYAKSFRHASLRSEVSQLPAMVTPMVGSWLDHRQEAARANGLLGIPNRLQRDSLLQQAQRLRDSLRRRPPTP